MRLKQFLKAYYINLARAVREYPDLYPWAKTEEDLSRFIGKLSKHVLEGTALMNGEVMRQTCEQLSIKPNAQSLKFWLLDNTHTPITEQ